jgi:hypothetical protein
MPSLPSPEPAGKLPARSLRALPIATPQLLKREPRYGSRARDASRCCCVFYRLEQNGSKKRRTLHGHSSHNTAVGNESLVAVLLLDLGHRPVLVVLYYGGWKGEEVVPGQPSEKGLDIDAKNLSSSSPIKSSAAARSESSILTEFKVCTGSSAKPISRGDIWPISRGRI